MFWQSNFLLSCTSRIPALFTTPPPLHTLPPPLFILPIFLCSFLSSLLPSFFPFAFPEKFSVYVSVLMLLFNIYFYFPNAVAFFDQQIHFFSCISWTFSLIYKWTVFRSSIYSIEYKISLKWRTIDFLLLDHHFLSDIPINSLLRAS